MKKGYRAICRRKSQSQALQNIKLSPELFMNRRRQKEWLEHETGDEWRR